MHEVCKAWVHGWKHALRGRTLDLPPTPHVDAKKTVMRSKRHEASMDVNGVVWSIVAFRSASTHGVPFRQRSRRT